MIDPQTAAHGSRPSADHVLLDFGSAPHPAPLDLSAAASIGSSLFLASDEAQRLERLGPAPGGRWRWEAPVDLCALFGLDPAEGEVDVEGLCVSDGWLWVAGSHSLRRPKPEDWAEDGDPFSRAGRLSEERNRRLLGRAPLVRTAPGSFAPVLRAPDGRSAARLPRGRRGLRGLAAEVELLRPFLGLPAKENGFDLEGFAAAGDRFWLGLRGPVLRGLALVLAGEVDQDGRRLRARRDDRGDALALHLLPLDGLGVRDMAVDGADLLLLAGPTMGAVGPARVMRWRGGASGPAPGVVDPRHIETVAQLPRLDEGEKPEALTPWPEAGCGAWLVLCDSPAAARLGENGATLRADLLRL